jgi:hypothetical protein
MYETYQIILNHIKLYQVKRIHTKWNQTISIHMIQKSYQVISKWQEIVLNHGKLYQMIVFWILIASNDINNIKSYQITSTYIKLQEIISNHGELYQIMANYIKSYKTNYIKSYIKLYLLYTESQLYQMISNNTKSYQITSNYIKSY